MKNQIASTLSGFWALVWILVFAGLLFPVYWVIDRFPKFFAATMVILSIPLVLIALFYYPFWTLGILLVIGCIWLDD